MPGPNDLTTLANAYAWTGVATGSDDTGMQRVVTAISTQIQNWLGYNVAQAAYSRTFNGQGKCKFFVPDLPLVSVQSLSIDGMSIPSGQWSGNAQQAGFYNDAHAIYLIGYAFTKGFQNVVVAYTSGYTVTPTDIEQACLEWIKIAYASKQMTGIGSNAISMKAGGTAITFGGTGNVTDVDLLPMPSTIYAILQQYRRVAMISGF